jgi:O-antigen/teichoic acid export membrane protein
VGIITSIYILKSLSVEEYGIYKYIATFITFSMYMTSMGLESGVNRYLPEYLSKRMYSAANQLIAYSILLRITAIFISIIILYSLQEWIISYFNIPAIIIENIPIIGIISSVILIKTLIGPAILAAYKQHYIDNMNKIIYELARVVLVYYVYYSDEGFIGILIVWLFTEVISFLHYFSVVIIKVYRNKKESESGSSLFEYPRIFKYLILSWLNVSTGVFKNIAIDNIFIMKYSGSAAVGLYGFSSLIIQMVMQFNPLKSMRSLFNPMLIEYYYKQHRSVESIQYIYKLFIKVYCFTMTPIIVIMLIFIDNLIAIMFEANYLDSLPVIYFLILSYYVSEISYALQPIINLYEKPQIVLYSNIFSLYNLVLDIILIKQYGIMGAAIATGSAVVLSVPYYFVACKKIIGITFTLPFRSILATYINIIPGILLLIYIDSQLLNIYELGITALIFVLLYLLLSYINKPFNDYDRTILNSSIGKDIFVF